MDNKKLEKRYRVLLVLMAIGFGLIASRLVYLQVIDAARYQTLATMNHVRLVTVPAPRGEVFDRHGGRLVANRPVFVLKTANRSLDSRLLGDLLELIGQDANFRGKITPGELAREFQSRLKAARPHEYIVIAKDVTRETVEKIMEQQEKYQSIVIDVEPIRYYPFGDLGGEVFGYVREITEKQLEEHADEGYKLGDQFGQVGLEYTFERYLRGTDGAHQVEVDAQGKPVRDLGLKAPVPGNNLHLTLDQQLQRVAQDAVSEAITRARQMGYAKLPEGKSMSGAAVVMDVHSGALLAIASLPSYDLNIFSGPLSPMVYSQLLNSRALRNHAISDIYTPGSTFKMVSLAAMLEKGIVDRGTVISDPGYYKYKRDWKPGGHGLVGPVEALKYSCDTFFYIFGPRAGPELMQEYAAKFGFGRVTGIELPGEEKGHVASRELKKKHWAGDPWESQWHEYDSMDMAIGQQETRVTALQLARYTAAIANGGTLYRPYLVEKITAPDGGVIHAFTPQVMGKVELSPDTWDILHRGMHEVTTTNGTASGVFAGAAYSAAAKTGTAEVGDRAKNSHALFVAYAPYEKPEVAVAVIIEYGGKGSGIAGPAARKILDAYFAAKAAPAPASAEH